MDTIAVDPIAALYAAGEGRFEWAEGSLVEMEPTSEEHSGESFFLTSVMGAYAEETDAGRVLPDQFAQRLDAETVRVPDVSFFKKDNLGKIKATHSEGGADLIVEIVSPDSRNRDRGEKFYEYERAGVEEYWIVDPERRSAEFYRLEGGVYRPVLPDAEGKVHSSTLPGFFLRVEWLWKRPKVLDALRELGVL
ncbi:Uma2 family endonuclease [bacterium]|nr:MAG: Uma2 family endonuclease [bacterium]